MASKNLEARIKNLEGIIIHRDDKIAFLRESYKTMSFFRMQTMPPDPADPDRLFLGMHFPTEEEYIAERLNRPLTL